MSDVDELVAAFKDLREGDGLTPEKLTDYRGGWLLDLLLAPGDPDAGFEVLSTLIEAIPRQEFASTVGDLGSNRSKKVVSRVVRVALAVGQDEDGRELRTYGSLTARRDWACGVKPYAPRAECFFPEGIARTHSRWEVNYGFPALARLVLHHKAEAEETAFQAQARQNLSAVGHTAPFTPMGVASLQGEVDDFPPTSKDLALRQSWYSRAGRWMKNLGDDVSDRMELLLRDHPSKGERLFLWLLIFGIPMLGGMALMLGMFEFTYLLHRIH